jgi:rhomboid-like protein
MTAAYFWLHRFEGFKIFGLPPDPFNGIQGLGFIAFLAGLNVLALFSKSHALDVTSHLVGLAWGVASGMVLERRRRERKAVEDQESRPADLAVMAPTSPAK